MNEEVSAYSQPIKFVVGFAGSGKSTDLAKTATKRSIVLTPTHKAKEVLLAKGVVNVSTIHSLLKLVPTLNMEMRRGQRMQRLQRIGDVDLKTIDTIIIDEFSMISVEILDLLLELLPSHTEVIVYGDPYQLPPVDGELVDPKAYTSSIRELTTQHRAEAPEVVETFMRFMEYIKGAGEMDLTMNAKIKYGSVKNFNPLTDRALAYTNDMVLELNEAIALTLNLPREISIGEQVSINGVIGKLVSEPDNSDELYTIYPKCISKGKLMEGAKLREAIADVEEDMMTFNTNIDYAPIGYVEIEEVVYKFRYDLNHYSESKSRKTIVLEVQFALIDEHHLADDINLKKWCADHRGARFVKSRGKAWSSYLAHQGLIWDLRRPFASTIHKSQGQEFSTVFIAIDDIKKAIRRGYYLQYARLMYVALSRAVNKVVLV